MYANCYVTISGYTLSAMAAVEADLNDFTNESGICV